MDCLLLVEPSLTVYIHAVINIGSAMKYHAGVVMLVLIWCSEGTTSMPTCVVRFPPFDSWYYLVWLFIVEKEAAQFCFRRIGDNSRTLY